jgi:hypothetical protein
MPIPMLTFLLAESSIVSQVVTRLANYVPANATRVGLLAAGLALGVLVAWCCLRRARRRDADLSGHNPNQLLGQLCQAHGLAAAQRRLLEWLAAERQLMQPAIVFLDPSLLEDAMAHADSPGVRQRLAELRATLFADVATHSAPPAPGT